MDEKILLVDDEKDIADLLEEVLIQDGFETSGRPVPEWMRWQSAGNFSPM